MHRATGNSRLGRRLVSMKKHTGSGGTCGSSQVKPKAGWKFVMLLGLNGHETVAKIRSHQSVQRVEYLGITYDLVDRIDYLE